VGEWEEARDWVEAVLESGQEYVGPSQNIFRGEIKRPESFLFIAK
jgi:hypothetical protein